MHIRSTASRSAVFSILVLSLCVPRALRADDESPALDRAKELYKAGDYEGARQALEDVPVDDPKAALLRGATEIRLDDPKAAGELWREQAEKVDDPKLATQM